MEGFLYIHILHIRAAEKINDGCLMYKIWPWKQRVKNRLFIIKLINLKPPSFFLSFSLSFFLSVVCSFFLFLSLCLPFLVLFFFIYFVFTWFAFVSSLYSFCGVAPSFAQVLYLLYDSGLLWCFLKKNLSFFLQKLNFISL